MAQHTHENQPTSEHSHAENTVREREVIVTDNGRDRSGVGGLMIGLIGLVVLIVVAVVGINLIGGSDGPSMDVPDEVNINVPDSGGSGGSGG